MNCEEDDPSVRCGCGIVLALGGLSGEIGLRAGGVLDLRKLSDETCSWPSSSSSSHGNGGGGAFGKTSAGALDMGTAVVGDRGRLGATAFGGVTGARGMIGI